MALKLKPEGEEGTSQVYMWEKSRPGREKQMCRGQGKGVGLCVHPLWSRGGLEHEEVTESREGREGRETRPQVNHL